MESCLERWGLAVNGPAQSQVGQLVGEGAVLDSCPQALKEPLPFQVVEGGVTLFIVTTHPLPQLCPSKGRVLKGVEDCRAGVGTIMRRGLAAEGHNSRVGVHGDGALGQVLSVTLDGLDGAD